MMKNLMWLLLLICPYVYADGFTSCTSTVTTVCQPGNVTGSAHISLTPGVTPPDPPPDGGGFNTVPAACLNVASIGNWQKTTRTNWLPNLPASTVDSTDYRNIFSPPGSGQVAWPSASSGSKPVLSILAGSYQALGFTMPQGITVYPMYSNVNSISQPVSMSISECPGDFGQAGTHITNSYCKSNRTGATGGGIQTYTKVQVGTCTLVAGKTYWMNMIAADLPPANSTTPPATTCIGASCTAQIFISY